MENTSPEISVIMAVYNTEQYLKTAIESILVQKLADFELIIVNDGSTDNSPVLLRDFAAQDRRIKLVSQTNAGIGAATRRAIEESQGRYIAIMDSDDISLPNRLALQKDFLDKHPEIDAVGSQWRMLGAESQDAGIDIHPTDPELVATLMYAYFSLHHPTTMIRRDAIEKAGGYSSDRSCLVPDYDIFIRMQLAGCKFTNLPEVLFIWRLNQNSTTRAKAAAQTKSVAQVRDWGFKQLLQNNPEKAKSVAKTIVYNFPTGTWQDHKIRQLCPEQEESLLYRTWEAIPTDSAEEQLNRALVLWLRKPQEHFQILNDQLIKNKMPWLAFLVGAYHGFENELPVPCLNLPEPIKDDGPLISLFVPFVSCANDFTQRLKQVISLQTNSDFSIELVVFSTTPNHFDPSLIPTYSEKVSLIIIQDSCAWEKALCTAQGLYFVYLEENFRFNTDRVLTILAQAINDKTDILYMLDERYFTEAVDDAGKPLLDNSPAPTWSRSTMLGKDRVNLTGFVHTRSLLNGFKGNFKECGLSAGRVLARHLAIHNSFNIVTEAVSFLIPSIHLNGQPLHAFQKTILDWYYDYGMTFLPAPFFWSTLSKTAVEHYARCLSDAWLNNDLIIHPGNSDTLKQFYLGSVYFSMQWPLFRHLLVHNKKTILIDLWNNKTLIDTLSACLYCSFIVFRNRYRSLLTL